MEADMETEMSSRDSIMEMISSLAVEEDGPVS